MDNEMTGLKLYFDQFNGIMKMLSDGSKENTARITELEKSYLLLSKNFEHSEINQIELKQIVVDFKEKLSKVTGNLEENIKKIQSQISIISEKKSSWKKIQNFITSSWKGLLGFVIGLGTIIGFVVKYLDIIKEWIF
jgi:hypothetical protein